VQLYDALHSSQLEEASAHLLAFAVGRHCTVKTSGAQPLGSASHRPHLT